MKELNELQQSTINNIINELQKQANEVRGDKQTTIQQKCEQMDILLDTMKFLNNYKENVAVLNAYLAKNRLSKYKQDEDEQQER